MIGEDRGLPISYLLKAIKYPILTKKLKIRVNTKKYAHLALSDPWESPISS